MDQFALAKIEGYDDQVSLPLCVEEQSLMFENVHSEGLFNPFTAIRPICPINSYIPLNPDKHRTTDVNEEK